LHRFAAPIIYAKNIDSCVPALFPLYPVKVILIGTLKDICRSSRHKSLQNLHQVELRVKYSNHSPKNTFNMSWCPLTTELHLKALSDRVSFHLVNLNASNTLKRITIDLRSMGLLNALNSSFVEKVRICVRIKLQDRPTWLIHRSFMSQPLHEWCAGLQEEIMPESEEWLTPPKWKQKRKIGAF